MGVVSTIIAQKLETIVDELDRTLVINRFNILDICTRASIGRVAIAQRLKRLTAASAECIYRTFYRLTVMDPTPTLLGDMDLHYREVLPYWTNFTGVPSRHTMIMIRSLVREEWGPRPVWSGENRPSDYDHIQFTLDIAELARAEYQRQKKVPGWILAFAFDSLSLKPFPQAPIAGGCLKVIAIGLGCDVSDTATSDERYACSNLIGIYILTGISVQVEALSALIAQALETIDENEDKALVMDRFNLFAICISTSKGPVGITQGLERLSTASAGYIYGAFYHFTVTDPTSIVLKAMHQRFNEIFPYWTDFTGVPFRHTMLMIRALVGEEWGPRPIWSDEDRPSDREHTQFALDIAELARAEYQRQQKVPGWILGFAFDTLSLDPLPQASIVGNCLKVIAIGLGCDISNVAASDER